MNLSNDSMEPISTFKAGLYSQFRDNKIPVSGSVVDLTAIYTKFTNGSGNYATYQLTLNTDRDVVVK